MKKIFTAFILFTAILFAQPVSKTEALQVANNYLLQANGFYSTVTNLSYLNNDPTSAVMVMNLNPGFIILSGDKSAPPILAYSTESDFSSAIEIAAIKWFLTNYSKQINSVKNSSVHNSLHQSEWASLLKPNDVLKKANSNFVLPLLQTRWNQTREYSLLAPAINVPIGCVAVAIGQIIRFYERPLVGLGAHSYRHASYGVLTANFGNTIYNYASMPFTRSSPEICELLFHSAVSVDMNFSIDGSGARSEDVPFSLINYFDYNKETVRIINKRNFDDDDWLDVIKEEIKNRRVIYYSGSDGITGGHAFVGDGYSQDLIHFNFGWGGNGDGYFNINSIDPNGSDFSFEQRAVIGIKPNIYKETLVMSSPLKIQPNPLVKDLPVKIEVEVWNDASFDFSGKIALALHNSSGLFLGDIEVLEKISIERGEKKTLVFSKPSINSPVGNNYQLQLKYYKDNSWQLVNQDIYKNPLQISIAEKSNQKQTLSISSNISGAGSIKINGKNESLPYANSFDYQTKVSLEAISNTGFNFQKFSGTINSTLSNPITLEMNKDHSIVANFTQKVTTYSIDFVKTGNGNGYLTVDGVKQQLPFTASYSSGQQISISAIPDEYSLFSSWGSDISGVANPHTLTVDSKKKVSVEFNLNSCLPTWKPVSSQQFNMIMIIKLLEENSVVVNSDSYVGAFVGNECRGSAKNLNGLFYLTISSNILSGEVVSFKLWNNCNVIQLSYTVSFRDKSELGTISNPITINTKQQNIIYSFPSGYTWTSFPAASGPLKTVLATLTPNAADDERIISQNSFSVFSANNNNWVGSLDYIAPESMYIIKLNESKSLELNQSQSGSINYILNTGYNWISAPCSEMEVNHALRNLKPTPALNDRIISQNVFAVFDGAKWVGSLSNLTSTSGYKISVAQNSSLVYPETSSKSNNYAQKTPNISSWEVNGNYQYNCNLIAVCQLKKQNSILASFINGEVRGVASLIDSLFYLTVSSNSSKNEDVSFKIFDPDENKIVEIKETIKFINGELFGSITKPIQFTEKLNTGINEKIISSDFELYQNYPNPFNPETKIGFRVPTNGHVILKVYDVLGRDIVTLVDEYKFAGKYESSFIAGSTLPSGLYYYQLKAGSLTQTKKFMYIK